MRGDACVALPDDFTTLVDNVPHLEPSQGDASRSLHHGRPDRPIVVGHPGASDAPAFGFDIAGGTDVTSGDGLTDPSTEEAASSGGPLPELADAAVNVYRAICRRRDMRALYTAGDRLHEVPFTMRLGGGVLRGTIDCLIRTAPDRMTMLEFKTGRPRDDHQVQLDLYCQAAQRLFPGFTIDAHLVYPSEPASV
jgi:hypothetical protein